ncbi:hypothetical protein [Vibrio vulnificus]|uniref:hypothetical protein n=1 Tax=Vibrio vulnificus TaxID=672 RepID=UPI00102894CB|nr:hypothetical protein [Vibrio vulnificus]
MGIGITGALLLSQALYWSKRTKDAERWFYKSIEEWGEETGMTRREIDTVRSKLRKLGILVDKKQGVPCRIYCRIDEPNLIGCLEQTSMADCANPEFTHPPDCSGEICRPVTENTQRLPKTTTETASPKSEFGLPWRLKR